MIIPMNNGRSITQMTRTFEKGQKVWVCWAFEWHKGVIREVFHDNSYLVKIRWYGLSREEVAFLEPRTRRWERSYWLHSRKLKVAK